MTGLLIKKQLAEIFGSLFTDRKTGKRRKTSGIILYILLYLFVFMSMAVLFIGLSGVLAQTVLSAEFTEMTGHGPWLYFALMGMLALIVGTIGSVFTTYSILYTAKDNELLMSLPIPASRIVSARILTVFLLSLLYCSFVWGPAMCMYWINSGLNFPEAGFQIVSGLGIALIITVISSVLGWLVALLVSRIRNKSTMTVIFSLLFFGAYYYMCFNLEGAIDSIILNADLLGRSIRAKIYPLYVMGQGCAGDTVSFVIFMLIAAAAYLICRTVLSRSFVKIVTMKKGEKKVRFSASQIRSSGMQKALFTKELKYFLSNPTYMLNTGIGLIFMIVLCGAAFIRSYELKALTTLLGLLIENGDRLVPVLILAAITGLIGMNGVTVPSVSLEGKNYWILRSLPVSPKDVLKAKEKLHIVLNAPAGAVAVTVLGILLGLGLPVILASIAVICAYTVLSADVGLMIGLLRADIHWTSAAVPIKQDIGVLINMLLEMVLAVLIPGAYYLTGFFAGPSLYLLIAAAVYFLLAALVRKWIYTKGAARYENL